MKWSFLAETFLIEYLQKVARPMSLSGELKRLHFVIFFSDPLPRLP